ncbi:hypothetical protein [Chitinophaga sp.]|uniref:hypothetical protein n=1 Tax=Chitinophaga sp. TaxID=1869181 RepID=UPI002C69B68F|nr:hypothetical protein [Chitinophaga sp.]HWV68717.1 hypothetical protein [Chitinophaga sp.]
MNIYRSLILVAVFATTLTACGSLEMAGPDTVTPVTPPPTTPPVTGNNKIEGNWNFAGATMTGTSTVSAGNTKAISYNNYTTFNNKGICVIDGSSFRFTDLSYSIDTVLRTVMYMDGQLITDMDIPFQVTMAPYSAASPYKLVGADSIYFSNGVIESPSATGGTMQMVDAGGKISWREDTLVVTLKINQVVESALVAVSQELKFAKQK